MQKPKDIILSELQQAAQILNSFISDEDQINSVLAAAEMIVTAIKNGNKIISCGNGGSMSDAMHFAEEMTGRFRNDRNPMPAIAISDPAYLSCVANDYGYESVFSRFIEGMGKSGDVLLAISTSGNSANIVKAAEVAQSRHINTVALTGADGGKLKNLSKILITVPHTGYADRIQEMHIKIIHILILLCEKQMN